MSIKILADENIDGRMIATLRQQGFEVISVRETYKGTSDKEILMLARSSKALLLTEDNDFGEWIFAFKEKTVGIIFLRYQPVDLGKITQSLIGMLTKDALSFYNKFTVLTPDKIRIRNI